VGGVRRARDRVFFRGTIHQQHCAVPPITTMTRRRHAPEGRHYRIKWAIRPDTCVCLSLMPLVSVFVLIFGHSENRSAKLPGFRKKDGSV
jgi:hypothetical protein